jgi:hypothetical protein
MLVGLDAKPTCVADVEEATTRGLYTGASNPLVVKVGEGVGLHRMGDPRMRTRTTQLRMLQWL